MPPCTHRAVLSQSIQAPSFSRKQAAALGVLRELFRDFFRSTGHHELVREGRHLVHPSTHAHQPILRDHEGPQSQGVYYTSSLFCALPLSCLDCALCECVCAMYTSVVSSVFTNAICYDMYRVNVACAYIYAYVCIYIHTHTCIHTHTYTTRISRICVYMHACKDHTQ
jgi:hypothetical protein